MLQVHDRKKEPPSTFALTELEQSTDFRGRRIKPAGDYQHLSHMLLKLDLGDRFVPVTPIEDAVVLGEKKVLHPREITNRPSYDVPLLKPKASIPKAGLSVAPPLKAPSFKKDIAEERLISIGALGTERTAEHQSDAFQSELKTAIEVAFRDRTSSLIGRGAFSNVYRFDFKGKEYAVKVLQKQSLKETSVQREFQFAPQIPTHPNVATSFFNFDVIAGKVTPYQTPCLVMEYIKGEPLSEYMSYDRDLHFNFCDERSLEEAKQYVLDGSTSDALEKRINTIRDLVTDLAHGLKHLHDNHLIHRDLKPGNIMVSGERDKKFVIIDYGSARDPRTPCGIPKSLIKEEGDYRGRLTPVGTQAFMGPEVHLTEEVFGSDPGALYGEPNDVWALGTTLYYAVTGELPFHSSGSNFFDNGLGEVKSRLPTFSEWLPLELRDLLSQCFCPSPDARITLDRILKHPFIQNIEEVKMGYLSHLKRGIYERGK